MKRLLAFTLGFLAAIGGFLDVGDLVANSVSGARFGMSLAWAVPVGVVGVMLFTEMSTRVTVVTGRSTFDLVRERLGARAGLVNLLACYLATLLTLAANIGGIALALELASSLHYLLWVPVAAFLSWLVIWRMPFQRMERTYGLLGVTLIVFSVAVWRLGPDWEALLDSATSFAPPPTEQWSTWWFYAVLVLGAAMTPYTVLFFSSSAAEEGWTTDDLREARTNILIGFPFGGILALSIMACAAVLLHPAGVSVHGLDQVALPAAVALGKVGLILAVVGFFASTFGASLEVGLAAGYSIAQYFGWPWGKAAPPVRAARFHTVTLLGFVAATALILTTVDPIKVTEVSVVLSAATLPLTYLPVLVVANDRGYLGDRVNGRATNVLASVYLVFMLALALAAIPLLILTKGGQ
ncbi:NRAMP family divalent metal transporter [Nocardiopsis aegyptia]|uniref:NRAMP family divalent metal transporter n=1 Tax=Nocardiopsis aegyptia TaxID=220378 RepID=UPI00367069C3